MNVFGRDVPKLEYTEFSGERVAGGTTGPRPASGNRILGRSLGLARALSANQAKKTL
jgi:hypothetical protein